MGIDRARRFLGALIAGMGAPTEVFVRRSYELHVPGTDDAVHDMRSDWQRIGDDFRAVIAAQEKEKNVKTTAPSARRRAAA